jgi:hypothetical protein
MGNRLGFVRAYYGASQSADTIATPEPSTIALVASALPLGLGYWLRRRRRAAA